MIGGAGALPEHGDHPAACHIVCAWPDDGVDLQLLTQDVPRWH